MKRTLIAILLVVCAVVSVSAQIGYQITVFDEAKKEPKANQAVSATVTISDNSGKVICTENVNGTTDEFGILSMQVGNATTFSDTDWSKLPLWISSKVDGVTISKTQILNVPVAEHAKHAGELTENILCSKSWSCSGGSYNGDKYNNTISFSSSRVCTLKNVQTIHTGIESSPIETRTYTTTYNWYIIGDQIACIRISGDYDSDMIITYLPQMNYLIVEGNHYK